MTFPHIRRDNTNPMLDAPTQALLTIFLREAYRKWEASYQQLVAGLPLRTTRLFHRLPTCIKEGTWSSTGVSIDSFDSVSEAKDYLTQYLLPVIPDSLKSFIEFKYYSISYYGGHCIIMVPKPDITKQITPSHLDSFMKATFTNAYSALDYAVINVNGSRNKYFYSSNGSGQIQHYFIDSIFQEPTPAPARVQQAARSSEESTIPSAARTVPIEEAAPSLVDTALFSSITDAIMLGMGLMYLAISSSINVFVNAVILAVDLLYLTVGSSIALLERTISMRTRPLITDAITHSSETVSVEGDRIAATTPSSQRNTGISLSSRYRALLRIIRANRIAMEQSFSNIGNSSSDTQAAALEQPRIEATQTVVDVVVPDLSEFTEAPAGSPTELVLEVHEAAPAPVAIVQTLVQETPVMVQNTSVRVEPTGLDLALLTETLNDNDAFVAPAPVAVSTDAVVFEEITSRSEESLGLVVISSAPAAAGKIFTHTTATTNVSLWDTEALLSNVRIMGKNLSTFKELHLDGEEFTDAPDKPASTAAKPAAAKTAAPAPKERPAELEMR